MTRRRFIYPGNGQEPFEVTDDYVPEGRHEYHIVVDIEPYRSMADGSIVTSRSHHREMLRRNNAVEIGNDSSLYKPRQPIKSPPGLKEQVIRAVEQVENRQRRR